MAKRKMDERSVRNLKQYKNLTDEEWEETWEDLQKRLESTIDHDHPKVQELLQKFSEDYDLSDMNINDTLALEMIARLTVTFEELQKLQTQARIEGNIAKVSIIDKAIRNIVYNISILQNDLNITRKSRQSEAGDSLSEYLPKLQNKAKNFLKERLAYIYCPKCKMLVCNAWFTNWEDNNELHLVCPRESCKYQFTVKSKDLIKNKNKNIDGVLPV